MAKSTPVQLSMFDLPTWPGSLNATCSPGSAAGRMLCVLLAGAMTDLYGQDRPHASRLAPPVAKKAETMPDTSPPILSAWSGPPVPQCCLANKSPVRKCSERLQAALESALADRLHGLGSTIYQIAWKPHVTPLGRAISRQRASARRTSDSEPSSGLSAWPTPTTRDWKDGGNPNVNVELNGLLGRVVWLAGWPTARANDGTGDKIPPGREGGLALKQTVLMAGWPTPNASDGVGGKGYRPGVSMSGRMPDGSKTTMNLSASVKLAMDHTGPARFTASGEMLTGCSAVMESGGQLNPEHSRWLMGYPAVWGSCGATAMQSIRTRRRSSSPPSTQP